MDTVINIENLGKRYIVGHQAQNGDSYNTLRDTISETARRIGSRISGLFTGRQATDTTHEEFWALRDVSFRVNHGERLGIIGRNGAGKSTLLKLISRITEPTKGRIVINGRVASLLEVGTGFHPELTGRENIYLNGAVLGMGKAEIKRKFDAIVDFSEVSRFLDTPVKRYSSGMFVRLAFAVAAHLEPEILLVDEVLAVGDAAFQKKCLGKMGEVSRQGRTVIFVSHNMVAVQNLCEKAIWLDGGHIMDFGETSSVIARYIQTGSSMLTNQVWDDMSTAPGNGKVRINRICVRPENGTPLDEITVRTPFVIEIDYWNLDPGARINPSMHVYNSQGVMVFNPSPVSEPVWNGRPFPAGLFRSVCHIPGDLMNDGEYRVGLLIVRDAGTVIYEQQEILTFDVLDDAEIRGQWHGKIPSAVRPNFNWTTELLRKDITSEEPDRINAI